MKIKDAVIKDSVNIAHLFMGAWQWDFRGEVIDILKKGVILLKDKDGHLAKIDQVNGKISGDFISYDLNYFQFFNNDEAKVIDNAWLNYRKIEQVCEKICDIAFMNMNNVEVSERIRIGLEVIKNF